MNIITGENVDLIAPFPPGETRRVFGWNYCYRTFQESDDVPTTQVAFTEHIDGVLGVCPSWGIIDKHRVTNQRHEAPLVGVVLYEPAGHRAGYVHFASGRKAFKMGLVDEAMRDVIAAIFAAQPDLLRVGMYMDEKNSPVKWLAKRLGFKFEGVCRDMVIREGMLRDMVYYGLPRREWMASLTAPVVDTTPVEEDASATDPNQALSTTAAE